MQQSLLGNCHCYKNKLSEIIASKMKSLTVIIFAIEPLGYESSSFNTKLANGLIQVWNNE